MNLRSLASKVLEHHLSGEELADRLVHSYAVAETSAELASRVWAPTGLRVEQRNWYWCLGALHDIGYGRPVTGLHAFDGAAIVSEYSDLAQFAPHIAWHSTAKWEYELSERVRLVDIPDIDPFDHALLWVADFTTGPQGQALTIEERTADIRARHAPDSLAVRALDLAADDLEHARNFVEETIRLSERAGRR